LSSVIGASFLHALTGGAKVTTTARNGQHIAVEADHAHRGPLERRPYLTLASEIRGDVAIANLHELPLREMHARVCDLVGGAVCKALPSRPGKIGYWEVRSLLGGVLVGWQGVAGMAIGALDMALWDALGRAADLPVAVLLGGEVKSLDA
jgi:urea transporter